MKDYHGMAHLHISQEIYYTQCNHEFCLYSCKKRQAVVATLSLVYSANKKALRMISRTMLMGLCLPLFFIIHAFFSNPICTQYLGIYHRKQGNGIIVNMPTDKKTDK